MIRRIRRWLNVKTWAKTHVPIDISTHEYELRGQLLGKAPEHVIEEYIELDRMILAGEIDETSAMTGFYQGLDTGIDFDSYWQCKKEKEEKRAEHNAVVWEKFVENQKKLWGEVGDRERVRREKAPEYVFPVEQEQIEVEGRTTKINPVHVPPRSGLLMPPKLTYAEKKMADLVTSSEPFLSEPLKLKPAFKKKLKASKERPALVTIEKGKLKKVKS